MKEKEIEGEGEREGEGEGKEEKEIDEEVLRFSVAFDWCFEHEIVSNLIFIF